MGQEDPMEEEMATHSSILAWRIPGIEESGGLQFLRSQRVGHGLVTKQHEIYMGHDSIADQTDSSLSMCCMLH